MKYLKFLLFAILALGLLAIMVMLFGRVSGEEFSAQKFTRRTFTYYQVPFLRQQLTPVSFSQSWGNSKELSTYLNSMKLIGDVSNEEIRWDIVRLHEIGTSGSQGDAEILTKYFDQWGAFGNKTWVEWTQNKDNSDVAATFWPLVAKLAHEKLYILIPDLFDAARGAKTGAEFLERVKPTLLESINRMSEIESAEEDTEAEKQLSELANYLRDLQPSEVSQRYIDDITEKAEATATVEEDSDSDDETDDDTEDVDAEADPDDDF